ncbi:phage replisome organizer N-terminal domain-containing protein [Mammaliicoccus sciuri]|uniref:phage replisome organizer N-terminal domain-containing protein n=1 Tax=Mammaliicoccus sciuri TaxID=1296 RepID=UPI001D0D38CF|nr:phage replisome organizer N-terminal domain-containing protein [Mammaliicoccus sciuri]MCC2087937.1 phage replisome organizer N-terminal domain-containing protein [Mammaliicoccus sciuri]
MSGVSWIKLKVGMFDDSKIKYIEGLPERDTIITIWVKLLTLAGKYNEKGYIMLSENLPYNAEMLANEFNRPINSVRLALETFKKLDMIENDEGVIKIAKWEKHQNVEGMEKIREQTRKRVQKHRKQKRLESCNEDVTLRNATDKDIELDKDIDKDIDKDKEIEKDQDQSTSKNIFKLISDKLPNAFSGNVNAYVLDEIDHATKELGKEAYEIVKVAIDLTISKADEGKELRYLKTILNNWAKEKVFTKELALSKATPKKSKAQKNDDVFAEYEKKLMGGD